jgi:hypothetical protein
MEEQKKSKRIPPPEYRFKPGQSGNPGGSQKMPAELQKANKLSAKKFIEYVNRYINMDREEIKEDMKRKEATMLELLVAGMISRAVSQQDPVRANFILDRTIGKVIDKMEIEIVVPKPTIIQRHDGSQVELGHQLIAENTIDAELVNAKIEIKAKE